MKFNTLLIVWFIRTAVKISTKKWSFLVIFVFIFMGSVFIFSRFGLLPDIAQASSSKVTLTQSNVVTESIDTLSNSIENPVKINIPAINLNATIANPTTTNIKALDRYLLKGAVRYPTSAKLGEIGNVVLFGHSSYLPIVYNQAYKTFNGIQKLSVGDTIKVHSNGTTYVYSVKNVSKESAASDVGINLSVHSRVLTLATCDSFGKKTDRFIVTANFVESHASSI